MTFRENIREFWFDMTLVQRIAVVVIVVLFLVWAFGGSIAYLMTSVEVRRLESEASVAETKKNDAMAAAAKIASEIRRQDEELKKREAIIDEESKKLPAAVQRRLDAERDLDRVRPEPITGVEQPAADAGRQVVKPMAQDRAR